MRVVYSDESGTGAINREPIAVVAGIMFNIESQWDSFQEDFRKVPRHPARKELKGAELFKDLKNRRGPDDPDAVLRAILAIPAKNGLPIFAGAVDRPAEKDLMALIPKADDDPSRDDDPYFHAFLECLQAVHDYVRTLVPKEKIIWIADDAGSLRARAEHGHGLLRDDFEFQANTPHGDMLECLSEEDLEEIERQFGPGGPRRYHFPVIDTVYFGNSANSIALQLADVCCCVIRLRLMNDPIIEPYYPLIRRSLVTRPDPLFKSRKWKLD